MRVLVRGKVWELVYATDLDKDIDGECDAPFIKNKKIRIREGIKDQRLLDVYVHEIAHASFWDLGEGPVGSLANAVALDLWEEGLRPDRKTTSVTLDRLEHHIVSLIWTRGEVAVLDEGVRREVAYAIAHNLNRLSWAFE